MLPLVHVRRRPGPMSVRRSHRLFQSICPSVSLWVSSVSLSRSVSFVSLWVSSVSLSRSQSLLYLSQSLLSPSVALSLSLVSLWVFSVPLSRSESLCLSESLLCLSVSLSLSCVSLSLWVSLVCLCLSESLLLSLYLFIYYSVETGKQLGEGANGWDSDALEGQAISSSKELESQLDASPSSASRQLLSTKKLYGLTRWSQFGNNPWIIPEFFKLK
jgi:hypothetical protein